MKLFEIILGIACIVIAIYNFDLDSFNRCIVSVLLFLQGVMMLASNKKLKETVRNASIVLAIFLLMKIILNF